MSVDVEHELPDTVVTVGGTSRKYHRQHPMHDEPQPLCSPSGRNYFEKPREAIESHYDPCAYCFPRIARTDE